MMGINLNGQFLFLLDFPAFVHDPGNEKNYKTGDEIMNQVKENHLKIKNNFDNPW
jgi:hypothetical protein